MGKHEDTRFPRGQSNYACKQCRESDHLYCAKREYWIGYEQDCDCYTASPEAHAELELDSQREQMATALLQTGLPRAQRVEVLDVLIRAGFRSGKR